MPSRESFEGQVGAGKDLTANDDPLCEHQWASGSVHNILEFALHLSGYQLQGYRVDPHLYQETGEATCNQDERDEIGASLRANRCASRLYRFASLLCLYSIIKCWILGLNRFVIAAIKPANATRLNLISETLGDPLYEYPDIAVLVYLGLPSISVLYVVLFQAHSRMHPMNDVGLRFMLKPSQEARRIDSSITRLLDEISKSLIRYQFRSPVIGLLGPKDYRSQVAERIAFTERQHSLITFIKEHRRHVWPPVYDRGWLRSSQQRLFEYFLYLTGPTFICALVAIVLIVFGSKESKCKSRGLHPDNCGYLEAFGPIDLLLLVEIATNIILINVYCGSTFALFGFSSKFYLQLANGNRRSLQRCLKLLRCANNRMVGFENVEQRARLMDFSLLKALVKFRLFEEEARAVTKNLSRIMCMILTSCITSLVVFCLIRPLGRSTWIDFSLAYFLIAWLVLNGLVSLCAYQRSQMLKSEKIAYSIMAEIFQRFQNSNEQAAGTADNPVTTAWRKMVLSDCLKDHLTVSPLNVGLTYERALQVNFFIVSTVALTSMR